LRGLTEPKCPSCALEFEWSQAVPIEQLVCRKCGYHLYGLTETRCPECGEPFTWAEVLDDYHRKRKPLFEYRWRDRPFRSLVYTWWLALQPWKLWRTVDLHDQPRVLPLLFWVMLTIVLFLGCVGTGQGIAGWFLYNYVYRRIPGWGWAAPVPPSQIPIYVMQGLQQALVEHKISLNIAAWVGLSFFGLLIFQQSMRLCRVRTAHVLRVWAYAVPTALPIAALLKDALDCALATFGVDARPAMAYPVILVFLAHVLISLEQGYRKYLRIRHAFGVAISSQVIALLAASEIGPWLSWLIEWLGP
jgi:ribosomal protein L37E